MILFSVSVMLLISFVIGLAVEELLHHAFSFTNAIMLGFLSILAVFHVIAYPMVQLDATFTLLFWTYSIILIVMLFLSIFTIIKKKTFVSIKQHTGATLSACVKDLPLFLLFAGTILVAAFFFYKYAFMTSDNSMYAPRAMEAIARNRLGLHEGIWWSGISEQSWPTLVDASTLESWKAYWSYLFGLNVTVFCSNTFTAVVHIVSWCSLCQAYISISKHKNNTITPCFFLVAYLVLAIFENVLENSLPFWTIRFPTQGKSMLTSIIYPSLIYVCSVIVDCEKEHISWRKWMGIPLVLTSGIAVSIVGAFWPFLCCLMLGIPYLVIKRLKDLHKLLLPLIAACSPVIIYSGISFLSITTQNTRYLESEPVDWFMSLSGVIDLKLLGLFVICLILTLIFGSEKAKLLMVGSTVTMFLTLLNPLLANLVSKYLAGGIYYRLFWMIPIYFLIPCAIAEAFGYLKLKVRQISVSIVLLAIVVFGSVGTVKLGPREFVYGTIEQLGIAEGGEIRTNIYGLSNYTYAPAAKLLQNTEEGEHVRIMWLAGNDSFLRQYSERIELIGGCRSEQWIHFDQPLNDCSVAPTFINNTFWSNQQDFPDTDWAHKQLVASGVEYICVLSASSFAQRETVPPGFELFDSSYGMTIYRILES